jgi:hypothetical protein
MKRNTIVKLLLSVLALVAVANHQLVTPARAAELKNDIGTTCPLGAGTWHFVNNQVGPATAGTLTVTFSCGTQVVTAVKVEPNGNQQFLVMTTGDCELLSAFTTLADGVTPMPGNLVLSSFDCEKAPKPTPTPTPTPGPSPSPSPAP